MVVVQTDPGARNVIVKVQDTGCGIPQKNMCQLLEPSTQVWGGRVAGRDCICMLCGVRLSAYGLYSRLIPWGRRVSIPLGGVGSQFAF